MGRRRRRDVDHCRGRGDGEPPAEGSGGIPGTVQSGDYVGELSLLRGQPRAANVTAGPDGVRGLILRGAELHAILEERPEAAMAMLATLAERLGTDWDQ